MLTNLLKKEEEKNMFTKAERVAAARRKQYISHAFDSTYFPVSNPPPPHALKQNQTNEGIT